ncbi:MAG: hypothetical protein ACI9X4_000734 [Glaciecola sp.]|jgi:hypothetical protein
MAEVGKTNRVQLHPGEPLMIRGIGQGANDFLASTPALRSAPSAIQLVAAEETRKRKLAMYADGARFDSAPSRSPRMTASDAHRPIRAIESASTAAQPPIEEEPSEGSNPFLISGAILGLLFYSVRKLMS